MPVCELLFSLGLDSRVQTVLSEGNLENSWKSHLSQRTHTHTHTYTHVHTQLQQCFTFVWSNIPHSFSLYLHFLLLSLRLSESWCRKNSHWSFPETGSPCLCTALPMAWTLRARCLSRYLFKHTSENIYYLLIPSVNFAVCITFASPFIHFVCRVLQRVWLTVVSLCVSVKTVSHLPWLQRRSWWALLETGGQAGTHCAAWLWPHETLPLLKTKWTCKTLPSSSSMRWES